MVDVVEFRIIEKEKQNLNFCLENEWINSTSHSLHTLTSKIWVVFSRLFSNFAAKNNKVEWAYSVLKLSVLSHVNSQNEINKVG